jgi:hypothetical protein
MAAPSVSTEAAGPPFWGDPEFTKTTISLARHCIHPFLFRRYTRGVRMTVAAMREVVERMREKKFD